MGTQTEIDQSIREMLTNEGLRTREEFRAEIAEHLATIAKLEKDLTGCIKLIAKQNNKIAELESKL